MSITLFKEEIYMVEDTLKVTVSKIDMKKVKIANAKTYDKKKLELENLMSITKSKLEQKTEIVYAEGNNAIEYAFKSKPEWCAGASNIYKISANDDKEIENQSTGLIAYHKVNGSIFAITCGRGKDVINEYIVKDYGKDILTKISNPTDNLITSSTKGNVSSNTALVDTTYKRPCNVNHEVGINDIVAGVTTSMPKGDLKKNLIQSIDKDTTVEFKDSVQVSKKLTETQILELLDSLEKLEKVPTRFTLGYFKKVRSRKEWDKKLFSDIHNDKINFSIAPSHSDALDYYKSKEFEIFNENGVSEIPQHSKFETEDLLEIMKNNNGRVTKTNIEKVLKKYTLSTKNADGDILVNNEPLFNYIQYSTTDEEVTYFLINGDWYTLNSNYIPKLNEDFENNFAEWEKSSSKIAKFITFKNDAKMTEVEYNSSFASDNKIILADRKMLYNIEIADLIYFDYTNHKIYLFHNKLGFKGSSTRDLMNQINVSAELIHAERFSEKSKETFEIYYDKLNTVNYANVSNIITKQEFVDFFQSTENKIVYVGNYMDDLKSDTASTYIKVLLNNTKLKLEELGMGFIVASKNNKQLSVGKMNHTNVA